MKIPISIFIGFLLANGITAQTASGLMKDAKYHEEISGNLEKAIELYQKVLKDFPNDRKTSAEALLHLGMTYEKMGKNRAMSIYRLLINDYSEFVQFAMVGRQRLSILTTDEKEEISANSFISQTRIASLPDIYGNISHKGRLISYVDWSDGNLALYDVGSASSYKVTKDGTWAPGNAQFSDMSIWSPDDSKLAYLWFKGEETEFRVCDVESRESRVLVPQESDRYIWPLDWKNSEKILVAHIYSTEDFWDVKLLDVNTGALETIDEIYLSERDRIEGIRISPDEKYLIYTYEPDDGPNYAHIHELGKRSGEPTAKIENIESQPFWSLDGGSVFYASTRHNNKALYERPVKDGKLRGDERLALESLPNIISFSGIHPETGDIFYLSHLNQSEILKSQLNWKDGVITEPEKIITSNRHIYGPSWSPDGMKLAYIEAVGDHGPQRRLAVMNLNTGHKTFYDPGLKFLEMEYPDAQIEWTPDGQMIALAYHFYDEEGFQHNRIGFMDLGTENMTSLDEEMHSNTKAIISKDDVLFFASEEGIIRLNRLSGEKKVIYSIQTAKEKAVFLTLNAERDKLAFFLTQSDNLRELTDLKIIDLNNGKVSNIWTAPDNCSFTYTIPPQWVDQDRKLFFALTRQENRTMQFHTIDLDTKERQEIGSPKDLKDGKAWIQAKISPDQQELVFMKRQAMVTGWKISNLR
jgi:Tol biopolymer transport system component